MENRRTIRNWDAFGRLEHWAARFMLTDLFDPVLKLALNFCSVLLLGVTFVYQSISMLIALDVVFVALYKAASAQLSRAFAVIVFFLPNERERTASISGLIKFYGNVLWARMVYNMHKDCFVYMSAGPLAVMAVMQALISFCTERLATEQSAVTQAMFSILLFTLFMMVFNSIAHAPDYLLLETVLLLRSPIDALCNSVDTVFRVCDTTMGADNAMPVYTTQIARYSFWSAVHLLLLMLVWSSLPDPATSALSHRADKFLYFTLFMHDLLDLFIPLRQLLIQVGNEHFVRKTFPRLSAVELSAVAAETCSVCLCEHNPRTVRLRCNHLLHAHCLQRILQQSMETRNPDSSRCPMCRAPIELPPSRSRSTLIGTGTRGNRNVQATVTIPFFGSLTARQVQRTGQEQQQAPQQQRMLQRADGTGGPLRAEQLIAQHLEDQNLQQGDLIHIRIIPRVARTGLATGTTIPTAPVTATQAPAPGSMAPVQTSSAATHSESNLSALHGIHGDLLYSTNTSRAPSASSSSAQLHGAAERAGAGTGLAAAAGTGSSSSPRRHEPLSAAALRSLQNIAPLRRWAALERARAGGGSESDGSTDTQDAEDVQAASGTQLQEDLQPMDIAEEQPAHTSPVLSQQTAQSPEATPQRAAEKRKWSSREVGDPESDTERCASKRTPAATTAAAAATSVASPSPRSPADTTAASFKELLEQQQWSPREVGDECSGAEETVAEDDVRAAAPSSPQAAVPTTTDQEDEDSNDQNSVSTAHSTGSDGGESARGTPVKVEYCTSATGAHLHSNGACSSGPRGLERSPVPATLRAPAAAAPEASRKQVLFVDLTGSDDDGEGTEVARSITHPDVAVPNGHSEVDGGSPDRPLSGVKRSREDPAPQSPLLSWTSPAPTRAPACESAQDTLTLEIDEAIEDSGDGETGAAPARKYQRSAQLAYTQCSSGDDDSSDSSSGDDDSSDSSSDGGSGAEEEP